MSQSHDRRAPGSTRISFDAMVEVGGALGPSFEAQALNLSQEGMSLRTAYLPEVGQPVMCRFDAGPDSTIVAAGEVQWNEDMGNGGAFGIRFTNLDSPSMTALQRVLGIVQEEYPGMSPGRKVRLHIEGLASPMRARVKDRLETGVTAYSDLGFLEMGKTLHLEDAESGRRRPAFIDRVQVETNQGSNIPQLVVSLRYDDAQAQAQAPQHAHAQAASLAGVEVPSAEEHDEHEAEAPADEQDLPHDTDREVALAAEQAAEEPSIPVDDASIEAESQKLKSTFARSAAKVTPALLDWAKRAKIAAALLAARARRGSSEGDVEIPLRRTTAPAPGGGLHTAGRKVVRGNLPNDSEAEEAPTKSALVTKKRMAIAGTIGLAAILATMALRKPAAPVADAASMPDTALAAAPEAPTPPPVAPAAEPAPMTTPAALPASPIAQARKPSKPMPFTNGSVGAHPNIIKIKMDGPVEGILGATQPSGFTIVTPNTKANDSANSLAAKDPRLEGVRIANEAGGAEFTVSFKDGVPNYIVRARGDVLEMVLADPNGNGKAEASSKSTNKKKKSRRH